MQYQENPIFLIFLAKQMLWRNDRKHYISNLKKLEEIRIFQGSIKCESWISTR